MIRKFLLKVLNGVPQEYHNAQLEKAAKKNKTLQKVLFSYEIDNMAKCDMIDEHEQKLLNQGEELEALINEVKSLKAAVDTLSIEKEKAVKAVAKNKEIATSVLRNLKLVK